MKKTGLILTLVIACLNNSCMTNSTGNISIINLDKFNDNSFQNNKHVLKGKADFSTNKFSVKSAIEKLISGATVSVIIPSDSPVNPNMTIATGLTDNEGNFIINFD